MTTTSSSACMKMSGKLVALLLVLSCATQGFTREVSYAENRLVINNIVDFLNQFISKIHEALSSLAEIFKTFENKIKDNIKAIDIPGILADIKQKIEDMIKTAGTDNNKATLCIKEETKDAEILVSNTTEGLNNCLKATDSVKNKMAGNIAEINSEASSLIANITSSISKCFGDNLLNPTKLMQCLEGLVDPTQTKVHALLDKIKNNIDDSNKLIADASTQLTTCVVNVNDEANKQRENILDTFEKCVNNITH